MKVKYLKEKSGKKVGDIVSVKEELGNFLIKKDDAELVISTETSTGNEGVGKGISDVPPKEKENNKEKQKSVESSNKNISRKDKKKGVTSVTSVTGVTSVTSVMPENKKSNITLVTHNTLVLDRLFKNIIIDKILRFFYENNNNWANINEIAENTGESISSIRTKISKYSDKFDKDRDLNKKVVLQVLYPVLDEISKELQEIDENIKNIEKNKENENVKISKREEIILELKNFYNSNKKSILQEMKVSKNVVNIDYNDLSEFSISISDLLIEDPNDVLNLMEISLEETFSIENPKIRIKNLPKVYNKNIENLRSKDINKFVSLTGRVVRLSDVRPQCISAMFECPSCGTIIPVLQVDENFKSPTRCGCGRRKGFKLISDKTIDTARLVLEDLQDNTENPHSKRINIFLKDDMTNENNIRMFYPGNEIRCNGILNKIPLRNKYGGISTRFELAIEGNYGEKNEDDVDLSRISDKEIEKIEKLCEKIDKDGFSAINKLFAPQVYGHENLKNAMILQLAASRNKVGKDNEFNKPNLLFIGDPGIAKSVLANYALGITPGSRKAVGGSSSVVGITAAVVKDDYDGGWTIEGGTMVLAKDFVVLDEMNNLGEEDKPKLQEKLSENTITVSKASINRTLKAEACVLAIANPRYGSFKDGENIVKQYNLTTPILNRFDLIFNVRDVVNKDIDKNIARIMNLNKNKKITSKKDKDFMTKFFIYIKEQKNPIIDEKIDLLLQEIYPILRIFKTIDKNINPRTYNSMLLLSSASAKIRGSDKIEEKDIERSLELLSKSYFNTPTYEDIKEKIRMNKLREGPSDEKLSKTEKEHKIEQQQIKDSTRMGKKQ